MEKKITLPMGEVFLTDEPERARELVSSGFCVITLAGLADAAAYVESVEDFDELNDEYIERILSRFKGLPYILYEDADLRLREVTADDYEYVMTLLADNREAVSGYDGELWTDDIVSAKQFEKTIRDYYNLFDFGLWILEISGEQRGIFGLSAEDYGVEVYYILSRSLRGRGISKKIMTFILDYANRELAIDKLYIRTSENNKPSCALAEGLGFKLHSRDFHGDIAELKFIKVLEQEL